MVELLIGIIGTDGSGKTTLANKLIEELNQKGHPARYVWFRFPRFLTLVLLLMSRLTGFTRYKSYGEYRVGAHYFHRLPFRILYPALVFVDTIAYYIVKVWIPSKLGYIIVCDRWVHDILVDVAVGTHNSHFFNALIGRLLYGLASRATIVLLFDAPDQVLDARRPETCLDPYTNRRRFLYRLFGSLPEITCINSDVDPDITWKSLKNLLKQETRIDFETSGKNKVYVDTKSPFLKRLFGNKYAILASNWTFQGMLIRTWSERLFRFIFELTFVFVIFALLSFYLPQITAIMSSIIIVHTFNWAFNGNLWGLLIQKQRFVKRIGRTGNIVKNMIFLANLEERAMSVSGNILALAVFGSLSRSEFAESSDIDVRMIRKPGVFNCFKANMFAFYLRSMAFIRKIPLDLYVLDNVDQIKRQIRLDEPPIIIYDPTNIISGTFNDAIPFHSIAQRSYARKRIRGLEKP